MKGLLLIVVAALAVVFLQVARPPQGWPAEGVTEQAPATTTPAPRAPAQAEQAPAQGAPDAGGIINDLLFDSHPLSIPALRAGKYPGSALTVRRNLSAGSNYSRQVVSYQSEGLRINALLTVPRGAPPSGGWPAIVFNHGYIPPAQYRTTERYVAYQDAFARAGFVTLKSDYRGHGSSEGVAAGGYNDPGYTVDVLNAAASLKRDKRVNPKRIGMWGHSMGGQLTLRALLVDRSLKAGVIWAGVVAPYDVLANEWRRGDGGQRSGPRILDPLNEAFLKAVSPNSYLDELNAPLQLHHGSADEDVPYRFQQLLARQLKDLDKYYEAYGYPGDNHNLSRNLNTALARSVAFFKKFL